MTSSATAPCTSGAQCRGSVNHVAGSICKGCRRSVPNFQLPTPNSQRQSLFRVPDAGARAVRLWNWDLGVNDRVAGSRELGVGSSELTTCGLGWEVELGVEARGRD